MAYVGTFAMAKGTSGMLHNIFAAIFFILLAYNSIFLFTKSTGEKTPSKKKRNVILTAEELQGFEAKVFFAIAGVEIVTAVIVATIVFL